MHPSAGEEHLRKEIIAAVRKELAELRAELALSEKSGQFHYRDASAHQERIDDLKRAIVTLEIELDSLQTRVAEHSATASVVSIRPSRLM